MHYFIFMFIISPIYEYLVLFTHIFILCDVFHSTFPSLLLFGLMSKELFLYYFSAISAVNEFP